MNFKFENTFKTMGNYVVYACELCCVYLWKFTMFFKVKPLTEAELEAVTIVFHQYETGLREGTIYTRGSNSIDTGLKEKGIRNQSMGQLL